MARDQQPMFASVKFDVTRKPTRRHKSPQTVKEVMPWQELIKIVEPFYPKNDGPCCPVKPPVWMLKIYFPQIWYGLSDPRAEEMMHDSHAVQEFLRPHLGRDVPPNETTILRFRHLLENHGLGPNILELGNGHLGAYALRIEQRS